MNKQNNVHVLLFVLLIFVLILSVNYYKYIICKNKFNNLSVDDILKKFIYYDERGSKINHLNEEIEEQKDAYTYIDEKDIVLELGGRYGTVSCMIAYKQKNNGNLVVIEPDVDIVGALIKNKERNGAKFTVVNKYISNNPKKMIIDGYATRLETNNVETDNNASNYITYNNFKIKYPLKFNVLVADCEGCFPEFIDIIGNDLNNYNKILLEADVLDSKIYTATIEKLKNNGFDVIKEGFRYVFIRKYR